MTSDETDDDVEIHGAPDDFAPGVIVVDRALDEDESAEVDSERAAVIVGVTGERADQREVKKGRTVWDFNRTTKNAKPEDEVITVVFTSELDSKTPGWDEALDDHHDPESDTDFREWLADYRAQWGVGLKTYSYPHTRLRSLSDEQRDRFFPFDGFGSDAAKSAATGGFSGAPDTDE